MKTNDSRLRKMIMAFTNKVPARARDYVKENWGAPFIVGFMVVLTVAAVLLLMNFAVLANLFGIIAYFSFVVGVCLQLFCFLKCRKSEGGERK